jgi:hypothetical protein
MKANLLYKFGQAKWCRHGLVLTRDDGRGLWAADTYWGDGDPVDLAELEAHGILIADLDQFRKSHEDEYYRYAEADRVCIPIGGSEPCFLVRADAKPDRDNAVAQIKSELEHWQSTKRSADYRIEELTKELATFEP